MSNEIQISNVKTQISNKSHHFELCHLTFI
jgi:hypothetical protein